VPSGTVSIVVREDGRMGCTTSPGYASITGGGDLGLLQEQLLIGRCAGERSMIHHTWCFPTALNWPKQRLVWACFNVSVTACVNRHMANSCLFDLSRARTCCGASLPCYQAAEAAVYFADF
jgi:hypothetical protein